jgi:ribonuclease HII
MIVGIDEVGRGCWAGPLVAAAVLLREPVEGLRDSKLIIPRQRELLANKIKDNSYFGLGWVWPDEIDRYGLTSAVRSAMSQALAALSIDYQTIIIDGSYNFLADNPKATCMVKADNLVMEVSAASILAKVARDKYMAEQALKYPGYGFEAHVGYGTRRHIAALRTLGITDIHRRSYKPIKALVRV